MINFDTLREYKEELKLAAELKEQQINAEFEEIHVLIRERVFNAIDGFFKTKLFNECIEDSIKYVINHTDLNKNTYTVDFKMLMDINLDTNSMSIWDENGHMMSGIELISNNNGKNIDEYDLFNHYYFKDKEVKLTEIADHFMSQFKQTLIENKLVIKDADATMEKDWHWDHAVIYTYTIPFEITL